MIANLGKTIINFEQILHQLQSHACELYAKAYSCTLSSSYSAEILIIHHCWLQAIPQSARFYKQHINPFWMSILFCWILIHCIQQMSMSAAHHLVRMVEHVKIKLMVISVFVLMVTVDLCVQMTSMIVTQIPAYMLQTVQMVSTVIIVHLDWVMMVIHAG